MMKITANYTQEGERWVAWGDHVPGAFTVRRNLKPETTEEKKWNVYSFVLIRAHSWLTSCAFQAKDRNHELTRINTNEGKGIPAFVFSHLLPSRCAAARLAIHYHSSVN